ncbi:T92 [Tupaiid betaherpesvirus 1]|uniref:T92 n=1 Tax=Tupaiid herpesvirus 1 (strain 1) TaxID=10397 RepID=Q997C5_TUHV1|nr:T92 [Tupaiid betaherpesvirus 1]AAK00704.1 T92 protein [Tupaiid betaherpesvirus 1]AAK57135.1 T92 [Tupaiid betaherpesvirus 1]
MFSLIRDRRTGKQLVSIPPAPATQPPRTPCRQASSCEMRNLYNPLTCELGLANMFVCSYCYRTHLCDLRHGCQIVATAEGSVCAKTGLFYDSVLPAGSAVMAEPVTEPNIDEINIVMIILSYVYAYLLRHSDRYLDVLQEVTEDGRFTKKVEHAIYYTFNKVFKRTNNLHRIPLSTIGQLFIQLIIGIHSTATKYDSTVIKVSRRKREDALLKQMRAEYGNAPVFGIKS